jgi:peroxiredoxin
MIRRILYILTAVILMSFTALADDPVLGEAAPDFELHDTNGDTHVLSDLRGTVVVLEWTNPNCPFVVRVYRDDLITELQREYKEKGVVWLAVNSTHPDHRDFETNESLNTTFGEWSAAYQAQLVDLDGSVGRAYNAKTTPHIYIIDQEGRLVYNGGFDDDPRGSTPKNERRQFVRDALNTLLEGQEIETASTQPYGCTIKYTKDT